MKKRRGAGRQPSVLSAAPNRHTVIKNLYIFKIHINFREEQPDSLYIFLLEISSIIEIFALNILRHTRMR